MKTILVSYVTRPSPFLTVSEYFDQPTRRERRKNMRKTAARFVKVVERDSEQDIESVFKDGDYMAEIPVVDDKKSCLKNKNSSHSSKLKKRVSIAALMEEKMEEALSMPISSSNVGFQLLKKKGYNEGEGLGKDGKGVKDPIAVKKRSANNVSGLGVEEEFLRKRMCQDKERKEKEARRLELKNDFIVKNSRYCHLRRLRTDIESAKKAIYELDIKSCVQSNRLWPAIYIGDEDTVVSDELSAIGETNLSDDMIEVEGLLRDCLKYLRETYFYCFYCGTKFQDEIDLVSNCPGFLEDDH